MADSTLIERNIDCFCSTSLQGVLNEQFHQVEILKEANSQNLEFMVHLLTKFINGTKLLLGHVDNIL